MLRNKAIVSAGHELKWTATSPSSPLSFLLFPEGQQRLILHRHRSGPRARLAFVLWPGGLRLSKGHAASSRRWRRRRRRLPSVALRRARHRRRRRRGQLRLFPEPERPCGGRENSRSSPMARQAMNQSHESSGGGRQQREERRALCERLLLRGGRLLRGLGVLLHLRVELRSLFVRGLGVCVAEDACGGRRRVTHISAQRTAAADDPGRAQGQGGTHP